jgi:hypothetical protein
MWLRDGNLAIWFLNFLVEPIETCEDSTRTCGDSIRTSGDLNRTYKLFLLCSTIVTLVFDINPVGGCTPNRPKSC